MAAVETVDPQCGATIRLGIDVYLVVPRTQNSFGNRDFSVAGARIWNDLPTTGTATRRHQLWTIQKHAEIVSL